MRSYLFTPGGSEKMLNKGLHSEADVLLIDLEDAIAPDAKDSARETAAGFLHGLDRTEETPPLYVRINDLESGLADADLEAVVPCRPDGIVLPKPKSAADINILEAKLEVLEQKSGLPTGNLSILVLAFEIPEAVLSATSFATCGPRVTAYTWGAEDMAASIGARTNRDDTGAYSTPFMLARNLCLFAAAAAGVHAIDTVFTDFRDLEGLERDAREAARDGFSGKMAIHPDQVPVINRAFTPGEEEIAHAEKIVAAFDAEPGAGAVGLDGAMVDRPHLEMAKQTLERAAAAAKSG
jgi:citrate lyase subunit beta/citryl-CoA lyase